MENDRISILIHEIIHLFLVISYDENLLKSCRGMSGDFVNIFQLIFHYNFSEYFHNNFSEYFSSDDSGDAGAFWFHFDFITDGL
jgi:hypothetical protein